MPEDDVGSLVDKKVEPKKIDRDMQLDEVTESLDGWHRRIEETAEHPSEINPKAYVRYVKEVTRANALYPEHPKIAEHKDNIHNYVDKYHTEIRRRSDMAQE